MEQFSESASALNRTERPTIAGCARSCCAVAADPVNDTRSCSPTWSSRPPALPQTSWSEPGGSSPVSSISSTSRAVRYAVWVAGLTRLGTPAMKAGANFSSGPQTGKLNALICTATPRSGVRMCWPTKAPPRPSGSTAPSARMTSFGSSRLALLA